MANAHHVLAFADNARQTGTKHVELAERCRGGISGNEIASAWSEVHRVFSVSSTKAVAHAVLIRSFMQLSQTPRIHPLIAAAAASIIVVCMLGVAVLATLLPFDKDGHEGLVALMHRMTSPAPLPMPGPPAIPVTPPSSSARALMAAGAAVKTDDAGAAAPTMPVARVLAVQPIPGVAPATGSAIPPVERPAFDQPRVDVSGMAASPVASPMPVDATVVVPAVPAPKYRGLSATRLEAARRATLALAEGQAPTSAVDDRPAQLRPSQLEEARRATAALAQASQRMTPSPAPNALPPRQ